MRMGFVVAIASMISGCAAWISDTTEFEVNRELARRAQVDLRCYGELVGEGIAAHTVQVVGCGRSAIYVELCERLSCSWLLNSAVQEHGPALVVSAPAPADGERCRDDADCGAGSVCLYRHGKRDCRPLCGGPTRLPCQRGACSAVGEVIGHCSDS